VLCYAFHDPLGTDEVTDEAAPASADRARCDRMDGCATGVPPASQDGRPRRIGCLFNTPPLSDPAAKRIWAAFLEGLREYGWVEGQNLLIEGRWVEGHTERYGPYAAELVSRGDIEVIVAGGSQATLEAKTRTTTIPILMLFVSHPVDAGFVASLARPGGNVTGISNQLGDSEKSFELLRELVPDLHRVFVLWQSDNPGSRRGFEGLTKLATRFGLSLSSASLATDSDLEPALASIAADLPQGLQGLLIVHPVPVAFRRRREIAAFAAAQHGLDAARPRLSFQATSFCASHRHDHVTARRITSL